MAIALALVFFITAAFTSAVDIDCNDGQFYIRADPESCRHFYKCDHGSPVRFTCPDTLYYNPSLHVCDWPQNVKCSVNIGNGGQKYGGNNAGQQYNNNGYSSSANAAQNANNNKYPSNQNSANNAAQNVNNKYPSNQHSANNAGQNVNNKYPSNQNSANNAAQNANNKYPSNQNSANNAGQQYNNGNQQYNRPPIANQVEPYTDYDSLYDDLMYPTLNFNQGYSGSTLNPDVGPSVQDPLGEHEKPRPTMDQLYSSNSHPYQEYLGSNAIDIRK